MNIRYITLVLASGLLCWQGLSQALTIAEKKAGLGPASSDLSKEMQSLLSEVNREENEGHRELKDLYAQVLVLYKKNAHPQAYKELLDEINLVKDRLHRIETEWREKAATNQQDEYALWHQPETTLEQLVIDYGSQSFVYLVPAQIGGIKLSINSNLPIPRSSWNEMLETILTQNGVSVKQLNPYLRELYLIREDRSNIKLITNKRQDLEIFPGNARIGFVVSPEPSDMRRVWSFLERFINPNSTVLQMIGRDILILAPVADLQELLKLYDFVASNRGDKDYKIVTLGRVPADEMAKILGVVFDQLCDSGSSAPAPIFNKGFDRGAPSPKGGPGPKPPRMEAEGCNVSGLRIIPLSQVAQAVFLIGTKEEIRKAEGIIAEVEEQVGEARARTVFWYTVKHSNAEELAQVLIKIYSLMVNSPADMDGQADPNIEEYSESGSRTPELVSAPPPFPRPSYQEGFYLADDYVVNPTFIKEPTPVNQNRENFLVDPKTGSIVMVVEADILPKLKEVIKKLDVPKKMVQIEVLLFEKKINKENAFGLNLLKIGSVASNINTTGAVFNYLADPFNFDKVTPVSSGVFEFLLSREKCSGIPAYDAAYKFLLTQDDVQINANPSVLAINQTLVTLEIAEEISVNTGQYEINAADGVTLKNSFARAKYGIIIGITPTVHMNADRCFLDDETDSVTLATDITFQTFTSNVRDRPDVTTRHIVNEVCIPDGQTVILGGLRQKTTHDRKESIPFLGEIPFVGKLFSFTEMKDKSTEMFIFLTPKIVSDPVEDLEKIKLVEVCRRPGDIPEFLCRLCRARDCAQQRIFQGTMQMLFGRPPERCIDFGEYDGRCQ